MILPLTHENMTVQRLPWVTMSIIAMNVFIFLFTWPHARRDQEKLWQIVEAFEAFAKEHPGIASEDFDSPEALEQYKELVARFEVVGRDSLFGRYGFVPARQEWADILSSIFLHAGWMHLLGNMYLLWLCGCTLEDVWGRPLYIAFYVVSGATAAVSHAWAFPDSNAHLVGASGAIAGLMGAFLIRFYNTRIRFFYWYWIHFGSFLAPAWVMLPLWLLTQISEALLHGETSPIAFWSHIGGFLFGAIFAIFLKLTLVEEAFLAPAIHEKTNLFSQHREVEKALALIDAGRHQESVPHLLLALEERPDDVDALHVLAQSYMATGRPVDAASTWLRKLRTHLKRRETDLVTQTYFEMREANHDIQLAPREALSTAPALVQGAHLEEAMELYRQVIASSAEPVFKLKSSIALADLYIKETKGHLAVEVLRSVTPLAESLPDWKHYLQQKMESVRA